MLRQIVLVVALAAATSARMAYVMSADSELLLNSPLSTSFSCDNRPYGYYADQDNGCQVFHVCHPITDESGNLQEMAHFTFVCGNQTVFNQESLTCAHPQEAVPCEEAASYYDLSNSEFFKIPEEN